MADESVEFTSSLDMFEKLAAAPATIAVAGFVKPISDSPNFHFSVSGCGGWVELPSNLVVRFEALGKATSGDHHHDVVRLHLKRPSEASGGAFADLLGHHVATNLSAKIGGAATAAFGGAGCAPGTHWDWSTGTCVPNH